MKFLRNPELPKEAVADETGCTHNHDAMCTEHECYIFNNFHSECYQAYTSDDPDQHHYCTGGAPNEDCKCTCHGTDEDYTHVGDFFVDQINDQVYHVVQYSSRKVQICAVKTGKCLIDRPYQVQDIDHITDREFRYMSLGFDMDKAFL